MAGDSSNSPSSSTSPNKRLKTLGPKLKSVLHEEQTSNRYEVLPEASPMEDDQFGSPCCGICLTDGENSIRGEIDSCNHYFCFVCIMEWAKVESRCPMCKRRFTTVRRPPKPGVFACERIVNVPERDQVYHLFGNATSTRSDPYAEIHCTMCNSMADESLLLLCDLCDSAAHTYCVGFGYTVPEGDWFCRDCEISRAEHEKADETDMETSQSEAYVSIVDIVHDPNDSLPARRVQRISSPVQLSRCVSPGRGIASGSEEIRPARGMENSLVDKINDSRARTLDRFRIVQSRIQVLRENWNSLRNGSLRFSSGSGESSNGHDKKHDGCNRPSSSSANTQSTAENGVLDSTGEKRDPYNIDMAWKMMDIAKKSAKQNLGRTGGILQSSKARSCTGDVSGRPYKITSKLCISERKQPGTQNPVNGITSNKSRCYVQEKPIDEHRLQKSKKEEVSMISSGEYNDGSASSSKLSLFQELSLFRNVQIQNGVSSTLSLTKTIHGTLSREGDVERWSRHFSTSARSVQQASDLSRSESQLGAFSSSKISASEGKLGLQKQYTVKNDKRNDGAKTEIQSLVKLNLKLLTKDNKLGVDTFKEIARASTHTILAACGLEDPRPGIRLISASVCSHGSELQQLHRSTLMPSSCRECFFVFVKNVVQNIMNEKVRP